MRWKNSPASARTREGRELRWNPTRRWTVSSPSSGNEGEELHALVHPEEGVNRFLGNGSFHGSAVFDDPRLKDLAFVSQRNVDNRTMGLDSFVEVNLSSTEEGMLGFRGDVKPSVDSPIQVRL